jgi:hypothetical protein
MALGKTAAKVLAMNKRAESTGQERRYATLCNVLDAICAEAPAGSAVYHPPATNPDALINARSRALLHLYLKARFGLVTFDDREWYVTDGKYDGGIDAYFIDKSAKQIHILQSKFRANASNFASSDMTASDLLKTDVARILRGGNTKDESGNRYNDKILNHLVKDYQRLPDVADYTTHVVLLGNNRRFSEKEVRRLIEGYQVNQLPHEAIYSDLLFPVVNGTYYSEPNLTIEINYEGNLQEVKHLVKADGVETTVSLFFVPTKEIGRIMHLYKNSILKYNPRSFLELGKNPVNREIAESIRSANGNRFALFNNGITMVSARTKVSSDTAKRGVGQILVTNPQLINGGQTAFTLATIYAECLPRGRFDIFKGKQVMLRIITFEGKQTPSNTAARDHLIADVSRASNSQTKVDESDRRSNDPIQLELQRHFFDQHGLYYERKKGEFSDGISSGYIDRSLLVDRDKLVRMALAADYKPHLARTTTAKYFKPNALATVLRVSNVPLYAYAYEVLTRIEVERKKRPVTRGDRFNTNLYGQGLRLGQYALVSACAGAARAAGETPSAGLKKVLAQWKKFEAWAAKRPANRSYRESGGFNHTNYYKGATVGQDLQDFPFVF